MKSLVNFRQGMQFESEIRGHKVLMDIPAPHGADSAPTPKELLLASIQGCSGMDVVSMLNKHKIKFARFWINADAEPIATHPKVFQEVKLQFCFETVEGDLTRVEEAVRLSMTKYCGVSAMVVKASPISYEILINGVVKFLGQAKFE